MSARAAKGGFPYPHRTVAEVWLEEGNREERLAGLDWVSRRRALTPFESRKLERLIRGAA